MTADDPRRDRDITGFFGLGKVDGAAAVEAQELAVPVGGPPPNGRPLANGPASARPAAPGDHSVVSPDNRPRRRGRSASAGTWLARAWAPIAEWAAIVAVAYAYAGATLLDFDPRQLQQSGEHSEFSTLSLLAEISVSRYHE